MPTARHQSRTRQPARSIAAGVGVGTVGSARYFIDRDDTPLDARTAPHTTRPKTGTNLVRGVRLARFQRAANSRFGNIVAIEHDVRDSGNNSWHCNAKQFPRNVSEYAQVDRALCLR